MGKQVEELQKANRELKLEAKQKIEELINNNPNGAFTHNVISLTLQNLASKTGCNAASNQIIGDLELDLLYGINEVSDEEN